MSVIAPIEFEQLEARAAEASELLSAMSSPKRLLILCKLVEAEMSVLDLAGQVDLSQPAPIATFGETAQLEAGQNPARGQRDLLFSRLKRG